VLASVQPLGARRRKRPQGRSQFVLRKAGKIDGVRLKVGELDERESHTLAIIFDDAIWKFQCRVFLIVSSPNNTSLLAFFS